MATPSEPVSRPPSPSPSAAPSTAPASLPGRLFPQAYRHTLAGGSRELLPAARRWLWALVAVVVLLLLLSIPVWRAATSELRGAVEDALEQRADGETSTSRTTDSP